jgi:hypothetical protein
MPGPDSIRLREGGDRGRGEELRETRLGLHVAQREELLERIHDQERLCMLPSPRVEGLFAVAADGLGERLEWIPPRLAQRDTPARGGRGNHPCSNERALPRA